jgi:hypothetical protein
MFRNLRISSIISIKTPKFEPKKFDIDNIEKLKAENTNILIDRGFVDTYNCNINKDIYQPLLKK